MSNFPIFSVLGIEIEYMLVDKDTLNVQPKSDLILKALAGEQVDDFELGDIAISNELVMHVLELKNNGPKSPTAPIAEHFVKAIAQLQPVLDQHNLILLPTGAHPWMNPHEETVYWPYGSKEIYQQYDAIFDCQGHGWSNLQSMHVNLPYANKEEFNQLHNVIRLILPLIPALAASSPFLDGKATGLLDSRLYYYCRNQKRIPSIAGDLIPEFIVSEEQYQKEILTPMYRDIKPYDPKGILQHSWLNSRAAIPKFDLKAIEIRVTDNQECPEADIAIAKAILAILDHWHNHSHYHLDKPCDTLRLKHIFDLSLTKGMTSEVSDKELLRQWQLPLQPCSIRNIWSSLIDTVSSALSQKEQIALEVILKQGSLSERILAAAGAQATHDELRHVYQQLAHCLISNQQFMP